MIKHLQKLQPTEEQREKMVWEDWVFDSHKWIETYQGYYQCEFCGTSRTNAMGTEGITLCKENPFIKKL